MLAYPCVALVKACRMLSALQFQLHITQFQLQIMHSHCSRSGRSSHEILCMCTIVALHALVTHLDLTQVHCLARAWPRAVVMHGQLAPGLNS